MMMPCRELRSQFVFLGEVYLSGCLHTERLGIVGEDAVKVSMALTCRSKTDGKSLIRSSDVTECVGPVVSDLAEGCCLIRAG